jgi:hypothetical protein
VRRQGGRLWKTIGTNVDRTLASQLEPRNFDRSLFIGEILTASVHGRPARYIEGSPSRQIAHREVAAELGPVWDPSAAVTPRWCPRLRRAAPAA